MSMSMDFAPVHASSSSSSLSSSSGSSSSSSGSCFSAAGDGGAANAKRKLEHSVATTQNMKMPRDTTQQRRRGSSSVVVNDPCLMKRSFSDSTICDVNGVDDLCIKASASASSCPKSPKVVALNALQKSLKSSVISPRAGVSPRMMGSAFGGGASLHHAPPVASCVEEEEEDDEEETCSRKHGQLSPLQLDRGALIQQQPEEPPQSPPPATANHNGKFARSRSSELLSPLCNAPSPSSPRPSYYPYHHSIGSTKTTKPPQMSSSSSLAIDMDLDPTSSSNCAANANAGVNMPPRVVAASVPKRATSTWQPQQQQSTKKNRNPGNLSLDLSQMEQPTFDPSANGDNSGACLRRNDSAAVCSRVTDFLYVGGASAAKDRDALLQVGITHIINCAANVAPDFFPNDFLYYNIRLRDHSSQDIARHFYNVFDFIEKARRRGGRVFVHCVKGISRSPTMAIAYLMWYKRIGMYKALDFIRQARPVVDPNAGFIFQLTEWEHLHCEGSIKFQRTVVFRVEVPRESSGNGNGSRAAEKPLLIGPLTAIGEDYFHNPSKEIAKLSFIVSCADYMFVWCGAEASDLQVEASQHATALLQNYESFPEKYEIVYHGQESSSFWSLVGALRPDES